MGAHEEEIPPLVEDIPYSRILSIPFCKSTLIPELLIDPDILPVSVFSLASFRRDVDISFIVYKERPIILVHRAYAHFFSIVYFENFQMEEGEGFFFYHCTMFKTFLPQIRIQKTCVTRLVSYSGCENFYFYSSFQGIY